MKNLIGKTAFVTAAAQGIGRASVNAFVDAGARVVATDIDERGLSHFDGLPEVSTARLDVRDDDAIKAMVAKVGQVDILFNCAGVVHSGTILEMSDNELQAALDINVYSMVRTIRAMLPGMVGRGTGSIINMSSVASSIKGVPNRFAYSLTKAAVIGLTKSVAADYVGRGVRCNAICPGTVESPSLEARMRAQGNYQQARAAFIARQPMGRLGTPEEVADLVVHLAGAQYTTGQAYIIDGGWAL